MASSHSTQLLSLSAKEDMQASLQHVSFPQQPLLIRPPGISKPLPPIRKIPSVSRRTPTPSRPQASPLSTVISHPRKPKSHLSERTDVYMAQSARAPTALTRGQSPMLTPSESHERSIQKELIRQAQIQTLIDGRAAQRESAKTKKHGKPDGVGLGSAFTLKASLASLLMRSTSPSASLNREDQSKEKRKCTIQ
ncbi:hypothetical protein FA15DRAFT_674311 [Coprinopsis marcescibilis]|uniref:Uncharacterized protein n=1 Tax=Coprinopsis marcescibilis TaxID=230819 RepID=A0A5C3KHH6_COPMA|nr:hypothetical protein FA15DRAFT_674311 [Coprinopsis marcescibilis]